jgi:phosphoglycolate phosphatase
MLDSISNDQNLKTKDQIPNPQSQIRILLWDIDGTLMRSTVRGGYLKYFAATMRKVYGSAGKLDEIVPSGMTDTQIIYESLHGENFTPEQVFSETETLLKTFKSEMTKVLAEDGEPFEMLKGVREILDKTDKNPIFINALLTGNLSVAAEIKLKTVGLWHYFADAPNAFGEISHNRADLAIEAGRLFNEKYEFDFNPQQFIVIGDTPNDIAAARNFGAKVICVETGRGVRREDLESLKPDALVEDLSDTKKVLELLKSL